MTVILMITSLPTIRSFVEELLREKSQICEAVCSTMDQRFGSERMVAVFKTEMNSRTNKEAESPRPTFAL